MSPTLTKIRNSYIICYVNEFSTFPSEMFTNKHYNCFKHKGTRGHTYEFIQVSVSQIYIGISIQGDFIFTFIHYSIKYVLFCDLFTKLFCQSQFFIIH